jgi:hypothetical protein
MRTRHANVRAPDLLGQLRRRAAARPCGCGRVCTRDGNGFITASIGSNDNPPEHSDVAHLVWDPVSTAHTEPEAAHVVNAPGGAPRGGVGA